MDRADTAMIILAGGASSRMGQDKCDLRFNGLTFLETQIRKGQQLGMPKIYVSGYKGKDCTQEIIMDRIPGRGPLGGLEACLCRAKEQGFSRCLVLGVDTPLVPVEELKRLMVFSAENTEFRAILLRHNGKEESLMAVYDTDLCQDIEAFLDSGRGSVFRFLGEIGYGVYDTHEKDIYFTNINDPGIYREIEARFEGTK